MLNRRLQRERAARKQAEDILEEKALELYEANKALLSLNATLEEQVVHRSEQLAKSEERYRTLVERSADIFFNVDDKGYFQYMNETGISRFGYTEEEIIGHRYVEFVPEAHRAEVFEYYTAVKNEEVTYDYNEFPIISKSGQLYWVGQNVKRLIDKEGKTYFSAVARDITLNKELSDQLEEAKDKALRSQQAEKEFLANMSHEIRTPLNAIIGMSHLLGDTKLDDQQNEYLEILFGSARILKNLIADILDMSKIDAGTLEVREKEFNLQEDLEKIIKTFEVKNKNDQLSYHFSFDDSIDSLVITDQQILSQVLLNLLSNADKFTKQGSVSLDVRLEDADDQSYLALFTVEDTGIGLDEQELSRIFQEFRQANVSIRNEFGGTGLGLTISKKLLALLDSELKVTSQKNEGSSFFFSLRLKKGGELTSAEPVQLSIDELRTESKGKICVVEDNDLNVIYISRLLEKWKLDYHVCNNGLEACEYLANNEVDIILMDLQMPIMDGFEATKEIRKLEGDNSKVPIVALTASTFLSKKQAAEDVGMTDFLSKPFTQDQLSQLLDKYLPSHSNHQLNQEEDFEFNSNLDSAYLREAYGEDLEYAEEMFHLFLRQYPDEISHLMKFHQGENISDLAGQVHKMKPTFQMVGLTDVTKKFQEFEDQLKDDYSSSTLSELTNLVDELPKRISVVEEELVKIRKAQ